MRFWPALIVATLLILPAAIVADEASETASNPVPCFVDLDGDGLDDNIRDLDGDGIPDFGSDNGATTANPSNGLGVFAGMDAATADVVVAADKFGDRKYCTRWLPSNRGGFTSGDGFGPGEGIGSAALGKVCIGGVCF